MVFQESLILSLVPAAHI